MDVTLERVEQSVSKHTNPDFRYEKNETVHLTQLRKKVSHAKGVLISIGGIFIKGFPPCIGDPFYREIPGGVSVKRLSHYHEH